MKYTTIILLLACSLTATAQKFNGARIQPGTVKQEALAPDAIRPTANGVLTDPALVFGPAPQKKYTAAVTSDIALSLAAGTQTAESRIYIRATGDGSHVLSFPPTWIVEGTYNPNAINLIDLKYDGIDVIVKILSSVPVIIPVLTNAVVLESNPDEIAFTYSTAVTTTIVGWSLSGSGGAITATGVNSGSGTGTPKFALSRNVVAGEVLTVSYNPAIGGTVSSTNNELAVVTNFPVETWDTTPPPVEFCDITVCATGGDYSTWQAASDAAVAGQTICGCEGTYRETIVAKTGVKYTNIPGDVVLISGLNAVSGPWTVHSGNIYKTTITLPVNGFSSTITSNTTLLSNQIFKDGVMMFQARYPNISSLNDLMDRSKNRNFSQASIGISSMTDSGLPVSNLVGASIWVQGWFIAETRTITADNGNTLSYSGLNTSSKFQRWYYVVNDLELLDAEKEWHYESNTLYFRQVGGGSPTGVEYKARNWGFDLRGKDNVEIVGLHFIGCEPATGDASTDNTIIDNIEADYTNHAFMQVNQGPSPDVIYESAKQTGMKLLGNNNTVKNSEFHYTSSQLIWAGPGTRVENNLASDIGYDGNYGAFVTPWPAAGNIKILYNTASRFGRSAVDSGHDHNGDHFNMEIGYNHFYDYLLLNADGGCIYGARGMDLDGTRIHHNWIHGNAVNDDWRDSYNGTTYYDGTHTGIYFDQGSGYATVDHNIMWDNSVADVYSQVDGVPNFYYNNTFASTGNPTRESYNSAPNQLPEYFRNNIFVSQVNTWSNPVNANIANSIYQNVNPLFVGSGGDGLNYRIQTGSPAKNAGVVVAGITDDAVGTPDIGGYEFDGIDWVPGQSETGSEENYIIDDEDVNFTGTGWQHATNQPWNFPPTNSVSFSPTLGAYLEGTFTGTEVKLYAEKRFNQGIVEVEIDGVRVDCDPGTGGTQDCDLYDPQSVNNTTLIGTWAVSAGEHDIKIELVGENPAADNSPSPHANIIFDYLEITP